MSSIQQSNNENTTGTSQVN